ncbi:MAG: hypothetical protein KDA58_15995, partial [Planctomycetaceae bacterium]|nr:hypothetical protein [Planctomycetaceae bacterium]
MSVIPTRQRCLTLLILLSLTAGPATNIVRADESDPALLKLDEVRWGFDQTVQNGEFNLLSLKVTNLSPAPWSGTLRLCERTGTGSSELGLPLEQPVTLGPTETRWIQYCVYVEDTFDNWWLAWGDADQQLHSLQLPVSGPRPTVLIYDEDAVSAPPGPLRRFAEQLFPQSVTQLQCLRGIILDHVPFWTGPRIRALREWLHAGGRVYLIHNADGRYPQFPESMDFLNGTQDRFRVGSGIVQRVPLSLKQIDMETARSELFHDKADPLEGATAVVPLDFYGNAIPLNVVGYTRHERVLHELRTLAAFQRPWFLIYLCVLGYLFV